ncbi:hypothetical protein OG589_35095 [Sphaerisporangium sp. NBC_01403]|uniref:hypothetical protein n=1 Tax=Sphaerisporangium sp. NBC_01403 TaxID=2903599 RepID=UPI0032530027
MSTGVWCFACVLSAGQGGWPLAWAVYWGTAVGRLRRLRPVPAGDRLGNCRERAAASGNGERVTASQGRRGQCRPSASSTST